MRLTSLLEKHQEILPPAMFIPLLPVVGDHLIQNGEYQLATQVAYTYCLRCCAAAREEEDMDPPVTTAILVEAEARSVLGSLYCKARLQELRDPHGQNRETVDQSLALLLAMIEQGGKLSEGGAYAWIILNTSVLAYQMAMVLYEWRFHGEAATVLRGVIDMTESSKPLNLAKFLAWRLQVYSALAFCHEEARDHDKLSELASHCLMLWDAEDPAKRRCLTPIRTPFHAIFTLFSRCFNSISRDFHAVFTLFSRCFHADSRCFIGPHRPSRGVRPITSGMSSNPS